MTFKTKLSVAIASFPYGGNGATSSEHPDIRHWEVETVLKMRADDRIASYCSRDYSDTPIPMTRNRALLDARAAGYDLLLMIDSDQGPNRHKGEEWYKPFWGEAFNFIYENYHKGPRLVFAPYVGPQENVYVFKWNDGSSTKFVDSSFELKPYDRQEAAKMSGIQEAAAGPTGMILIDLRLLDLIEPSGLPRREVLERVQDGRMTVDEGLWALHEGFFYYEWENAYAANKASTEDVTFTRDIALAGVQKLGYNPVFCAWDSWIGHHKPICVGKPERFTSEHVGAALHKAFREGDRANESILDLNLLEGAPSYQDWLNSGGRIAVESRASAPVHWDNKSRGIKAECCQSGTCDKQAVITARHWSPLPSALELVRKAVAGKQKIVDIGPGSVPFPMATDFVGKRDPGTPYHGTFHELDLDTDPLPFADGEVDFIYCRHTLEDLQNPAHLLSEIKRVAKAGYIETPSPMAEATRGVNAPDATNGGRGYPHHHSVVWASERGLYVLPKMPAWELIEFPDYIAALQIPELWNSYYFWEGPLCYYLLKNDRDYLLSVDDRYQQWALKAVAVSQAATEKLFGPPLCCGVDLSVGPSAPQGTGKTESVTYGPWHEHGHAPPSQRAVLTDLARAASYRVHPKKVRVLEVGTWLGMTAMAFEAGSKHIEVHCVDTWAGTPTDPTGKLAEAAGGPEQVYAEFLRRIGSRLNKTIFPWRGTSDEMSQKHWEPFDIIFIDADHSYEGCRDDIANWWPHLAPGGIMVGHDFATHGCDGVRQAVEERFGEDGYDTLGWSPQGCLWLVRKNDHSEKKNGQATGQAVHA